MGSPSQAASVSSQTSSGFSAYYLQRATKDFAEDLDKIRNADDFKTEAIPTLVHALQQGATMFSPEDQKRVMGTKSQEKIDAKSDSKTSNGKADL